MNNTTLSCYVSKADTNILEIVIRDTYPKDELAALGFAEDRATKKLKAVVKNSEEKAYLFAHLRDLGIPFSYGKEWCPAEVFEYLREQGLIEGEFKQVQWKNPDDFYISLN